MVKMARSHTSGQHALSCTAVEPGQLEAAEWRLRHSSHISARLAPDRGLGFAVSEVCLQPALSESGASNRSRSQHISVSSARQRYASTGVDQAALQRHARAQRSLGSYWCFRCLGRRWPGGSGK